MATRHYGVSKPISESHSTPEGDLQTKKMIEALERDFPLEDDEGMKRRALVVEKLEKLVHDWTYEVAVTNAGIDEETAAEIGGSKIFTFGSYRLGVVAPSSDMDLLVVAPKHMSRDHFFQSLPPKLQEIEGITQVNPILEAYTPIITFEYFGVAVDLSFCKLALNSLRDLTSLQDDNLLINVEERAARSLNGPRVNDGILNLVPNKDTFREALWFVKNWAKRRGISGNMLGYLGGISWAILVARVCQLYPNYSSGLIISRFFKIYTQWNWKNPLLLKTIFHTANPGLVNLKVWDPRSNPHDAQHILPIITPAFPSMNSTHNVGESQKATIIEECKRGYALIHQIFAGKKEWSAMYDKLPFFEQYGNFIRVQIMAKAEDVFLKYSSFIESKLRFLVKHLEPYNNFHVRILPGLVDNANTEVNYGGDAAAASNRLVGKTGVVSYAYSKQCFVGMHFKKRDGFVDEQLIDLREGIVKFVEAIDQWPAKEEYENQYEVVITHCLQDELPAEVRPLTAGGAVGLAGSAGVPSQAKNAAADLAVAGAIDAGLDEGNAPGRKSAGRSRSRSGGRRSRSRSAHIDEAGKKRAMPDDNDDEGALQDMLTAQNANANLASKPPAKKAKKQVQVNL